MIRLEHRFDFPKIPRDLQVEVSINGVSWRWVDAQAS